MATQGQHRSSTIEVTWRTWSFQERKDRRGLGAAESFGLPPAVAEGRGEPSGDVAVLLHLLLGRSVQQTREKKPSSQPPGFAITWRRTPRGGRPLPGIQPNRDSSSSAAKIPKPCKLAARLSRLPPLAPRPPFRNFGVADAKLCASLKESARGLREALVAQLTRPE